jgi:predicted nucleotidyltransferase
VRRRPTAEGQAPGPARSPEPAYSTGHADVDALLDLLGGRIRALLGPKLLGLYLTGSLVTGDFDPLVSDVDLLAVTSVALSRRDVERLAAMHAALATQEPRWQNRIEVAYLSRAALRTYRTRTSTMAVTSPGEPFHTKPAGRDWLLNWFVVRERGVALHGPPPAAFIGPISAEEVTLAVHEGAEWRRARVPRHRNGQVFTILTMCRALHTVETGELASKRQAAAWAASALPEWAGLIEGALTWWREHWYDQDVDHEATAADTVAFVDDLADRIAAAAGRAR